MSDIGAGDVVECINVGPLGIWPAADRWLKLGAVYRVTHVVTAAVFIPGGLLHLERQLVLRGVDPGPCPPNTPGFAVERFRKIDKGDISEIMRRHKSVPKLPTKVPEEAADVRAALRARQDRALAGLNALADKIAARWRAQEKPNAD